MLSWCIAGRCDARPRIQPPCKELVVQQKGQSQVTTSLVTGGAGFIGSHLVRALVKQHHRVVVVDDLSTGTLENLEDVLDQVDFRQGSITDPMFMKEACREVEVVYHQAALASVARSVDDPTATHRACVDGTLTTLIAAKECKVRRFVYAASSSAYGGSDQLPIGEETPLNPLSPYAAAKLAGEHYCAAFYHVYGLETVRLRYFNVFGPRQDPNSPYSAVIPLFIRALLHREPPTINGDGLQSRDFTYIDNVVHANLLAARAGSHVAGRVYNVATGARINLLQLVGCLQRIIGVRVEPVHGPPRPGDVRHSQADITRARQELGYEVIVPFEEGLRRTVAYYAELFGVDVPVGETTS